jgi:dihydrofolate reductase
MMARLLVLGYSISLDGYGAGPDQSAKEPLGVGGEDLHDWLVNTPTFKKIYGGAASNETDVDDQYAARAMAGIGAWIMGRNMFGPVRGPWPDESWRGWWGKNPPYHAPSFVLTHYERRPAEMEGATTFYFVTEGIHVALERARAVAGDRDIRLLGGASVIRQYLEAQLVDEMHLAVTPILLGSGEHLLAGLDLPALGYKCTKSEATARATHYSIART